MIELAVIVAVQIGQCLKAVGCRLACARAGSEDGVVAKEFAPAVYRSITVEVSHDDGFARSNPAAGSLGAVAVVVEEDGRGGVDGAGGDASAV